MKKLIALILAAIMMLSLVACAEGGNTETQKPTQKPTEKPTEAPTEAPTEEPTEAPEEWVEVGSGMMLRTNLSAGNMVKLTADIETANDSSIPIDAVDATLDLNGHTLTFVNKNENVHFITVMNGEAHFRIIDSSEAQTGTVKIIINKDGISSQVFRVNSVNTITIEGGTFIYEYADGATTPGTRCNIVHSNGATVINGGTFINNVGGKTVNNYAGTQTLNGGKFNVAPTAADTEVTGTIVGPDAEGFYTVADAQ